MKIQNRDDIILQSINKEMGSKRGRRRSRRMNPMPSIALYSDNFANKNKRNRRKLPELEIANNNGVNLYLFAIILSLIIVIVFFAIKVTYVDSKDLKSIVRQVTYLKNVRDNSFPYSAGVEIAMDAAFVNYDDYYVAAMGNQSFKIDRNEVGNYSYMKSLNDDYVGWLRVPGTEVDYPVMQSIQGDGYYLNHDFYQEPNKYGLLGVKTNNNIGSGTILDTYREGQEPDINIIIFGNNFISGEIFGTLHRYSDEKYYKKNNIVEFYTDKEIRLYEILSVIYTKMPEQGESLFSYDGYTGVGADKEDYNNYYYGANALSIHANSETPRFPRQLITLVTDSPHSEEGRLVIVAARVK